MQQMDGNTHDIVNDNLEALKQLFPEAFSEDKVDFEKLQLLLGANISNDKEKYSFSWKGKNDAIKLALAQNTGTLRPDKESSKNWDTTENLYIEGDNLEVLRTLQDSYRGQVKMIYIDPPYNTGKDFVYKDNFVDNVSSYKEMMGENMKSNPETNGRYHTDWLNMMYPRLKLARNLLREDGVIFMSIDSNELHNLRKISDEIFGEENFIATLHWKKKKQPSFLARVAGVIEYLVVYERSTGGVKKLSVESINDSDKPIINSGNKESVIKFPKGMRVKANIDRISKGIIKNKTIGLEFLDDVLIENGRTLNELSIKGPFRYNQNSITPYFDQDLVFITSNLGLRRDVSEEESNKHKSITDLLVDWGQNQDSDKEQLDLFNNRLFDNPKPLLYIKNIIKSMIDNDSIVLDFFSGSATTAHAVMQLNAEDGGKRRFVLAQIPEDTDEKSEAYKAGYKNICEIGKERIRRAGEKILEDNKDKEGIEDLDIGFKVFKLDTTNLKKWETSLEGDSDEDIQEELQTRLQDMTNPVKEDRDQIDMIYEIMLKNGMDLSLPMEEKELNGKKVFSIASNYLIACLEKDIDLETIKQIGNLNPKVAVFYDDSFADDVVKVNAMQQLEKQEIQVRVI